jgi:hypothetical protein
MISRRPLGDMLSEVAAGALEALVTAPAIGVNELMMELPVEIRLDRTQGQVRVLGDLPRTRTRTDFDAEPGRLRVIWRAESIA